MTTPTGQISMSDVNLELGKAASTQTSLNDADVRALAAIPSGTISMNDLRGKSAVNYGTLTPNFTTRSEGQSFTFTLAGGTLPNGTYYWRVETLTNLVSADFSATTGSFTVSSNTGNFNVQTVLNKATYDGTFRVVLGDASGVPVVYVTSTTCTVNNTTDYGTLTATNAFRTEGTSFTMNLNAVNIPNGTYYWSIDSYSFMTSADLANTSGSFTVTSNAGSFTINTVDDSVFEQVGIFTVKVGEASGVPTARVVSGNMTLSESSSGTASAATTTLYRLGSSSRSTSITLSITNAPAGTYYWKTFNISGTLIGSGGDNTGDITQALTGSITTSGTTASNSGNLTLNTSSYFDGSTVAQKQFVVQFYADSGRTIYVGGTQTITILAAPTYSLTASGASLYRYGAASDRQGTNTWTTSGIGGTHVFGWDVTPSTVLAGTDLTATTGIATPVVGLVIVPLEAVAVALSSTLAQETFSVRLYGDSARTTLIATATGNTIRAAPSFSMAFSPTSVNEGSSSTLTITSSNVPSASYPLTCYYTTGGTASPTVDWLGGAASGSVSLTSASTAIVLGIALDGDTTSSETLTFALRENSISGTVLANSNTLTINSFNPSYTLTLARTGGSTSGAAVTITGRITGIAAYPVARSFAITYSLNGGAYTSSGLITSTISVSANSTSSSTTTLYNTPGPNLVSSMTIRATLTNHTTVTSNNLSGFYIG